jgi:hypothetical protein
MIDKAIEAAPAAAKNAIKSREAGRLARESLAQACGSSKPNPGTYRARHMNGRIGKNPGWICFRS